MKSNKCVLLLAIAVGLLAKGADDLGGSIGTVIRLSGNGSDGQGHL